MLPLLSARDLLQPLAWRKGRPISAGMFIAEARAIARDLSQPLAWRKGRPISLAHGHRQRVSA